MERAKPVILSDLQQTDLMQSLSAADNKQEAAVKFIEKHGLSCKPASIVARYDYALKKQQDPDFKKRKLTQVTQVPQSKLPTGFSLMQTILSSNIELTPNSKITITPTELHIQF